MGTRNSTTRGTTYLLLAIVFAAAHYLILRYSGHLVTEVLGEWNWAGKATALAFSLLILLAFPHLRASCGFTLEQRDNTVPRSLAAIALLITAAFALSFTISRAFSIETLLFQLTMPSLDEEVAYRGIFLCLLIRALPFGPTGSVITAALLTTLLFGLMHGLSYEGEVHLDLLSFLITGGIGAVLVYIRLTSGSLLFPVLGHSAFNITLSAGAMLRQSVGS